MPFSVQDRQGISVVTLNGEVDLNNSPDARKLILASLKQRKQVMVDLSAVEYIDSSGVASLVEGLQYARSNDQAFGLIGASKAVMSVLRLARLDRVFPLFESLEGALQHGG